MSRQGQQFWENRGKDRKERVMSKVLSINYQLSKKERSYKYCKAEEKKEGKEQC